jgi:hypothetical protein
MSSRGMAFLELTAHRYSVYRSIVSIVRYSFRPRIGVDQNECMRELNILLNMLKDDAE